MTCNLRMGREPLRRVRGVLVPLLALTVLLLSGCSVIAPKPQPLDLVVLHTNDTFGFTKPAT